MASIPKLINALQRSFASKLRSVYHFFLAWFGSVVCLFPSQKLRVIAVTGTKGKSSVAELVAAIFTESGERVALLNSIHIQIADNVRPNTMRMSMPGRFYIQRFLAKARMKRCTAAVLEMTSEGARQHRHRFIELDALIFTNLAPEHIESHGSLENYANAKRSIGIQLVRSQKRPRIMVANSEDPQSAFYLGLPVEKPLPFSLAACAPYAASDRGGYLTLEGVRIETKLPGEFSLRNVAAAVTLARAFGISMDVIARAIGKVESIAGRAQRIEAGQDFDVVVDYAHTPDSLEALYQAYAARRKICVLGSTGGGRDTWKRPVMASMAEKYCDEIILTNEDPYDEDPVEIIKQLQSGMKKFPRIIMDRREAIARALSLARTGDAVLITGKGTDPTIAGPHGTKTPWSDSQVAREELEKLTV